MVRKIIIGISGFLIIIAGCLNSAYCIEQIEFNNIDSFIKSFKKAKIAFEAEGDLMGKGRTDWAGIILLEDENETQIYILEKLKSGNYAIVEKSQTRIAAWGTGNFIFEGIEIKNKSLFIDHSYHYGQYQCSGNVISQFKLYKNIWRMIGVKSDEVCGCTGIRVFSDTNLITGNAIVSKSYENGKKHNRHFKTKPKLILFKDFVDGEELMSMHEKHSICQPCPFKSDE